MKNKPYFAFTGIFLFAAAFSLCFPKIDGQRRLASCVEETVQSPLAFDSQLFSHIEDEALRTSALQYYAFLTQVEMNALKGLDSARTMYGLPSLSVGSASNLYAPPTISNFQLQANPYHLGSWGVIPTSSSANPVLSSALAPSFTPSSFAMAPIQTSINIPQ